MAENESGIDRRNFLGYAGLGAAAAIAAPLTLEAGPQQPASASEPQPIPDFELDEITVAQLQDGMRSGRWTSKSLVESYLGRIDLIDKRGPAINAIIELNPDAIQIAQELDSERKSGNVRGPLHGVPILIKDNIDTADKMHTTAGSLALSANIAARDSFVVKRLRAAGAVILGKTNLSEWANYRSTHSTSGWSGRGGQTRSPYALDRNPCGSSSGTGSAIAANLAAIGIGTETDGSIVCPSSSAGLAGIKPTLGLISRSGIIPIAHSQDTAGPMCRTVTDAVILLTALAGVDDTDAATLKSRGKAVTDYTKFLDPNGLKGARIGVARKYFGFNDHVDRLMKEALDVIGKLGATLVDPADIATSGKFDDSEGDVLSYEFKADLNKYLASCPPAVESRTLADLIRFNEANRDREMPFFGQELFEKAQERGPLTAEKYKKALAKNHRLARTEGIDAVMKKHRLDALVAPTGGPVWPTDLINGDHFTGGYSSASAVAGYPHVTVTAGQVFGLPVGLSFFAGAWSEPALIRFAFAFEQATKARRKPQFLPRVL